MGRPDPDVIRDPLWDNIRLDAAALAVEELLRHRLNMEETGKGAPVCLRHGSLHFVAGGQVAAVEVASGRGEGPLGSEGGGPGRGGGGA